MATKEMNQLDIKTTDGGSYSFPIVDQDARDTAQEAKAAAAAVAADLEGKQPAGDYLTEEDLAGYATENFVTAKIAEAELSGGEVDLSGYATKDDIPKKTSQLTNDSGYITGYTETDPTVPAWAKAAKKPTYTAEEVGARPATWMPSASDVGALPDTTVIPAAPTKVSQLQNDKGYLTAVPAEYITETELEGKGYLTEHQSLAAYAKKTDIPTIPATLPNPKKLTFSGAATGEYDGSAAVKIAIPECSIPRIESLDESNLKNLRDLETGSYVLYGYFRPYPGASNFLPFDNLLVNVYHVDEGSHLFEFSTANSEVNFIEILADSTAESGYTYSRTPFNMLDLNGLIGKVNKLGFDPTVYGLPVLYLTGDTAPIAVSKDNKVTLNYVYGERSGSCTLKGQGATSYKTAQALVNAGKKGKFNYTITFDTAFEAKEGWGAQKKYCFKANFIDPTHSRNICSCILWGMSVKSRSTVPAELADLPNGGAIDGFPIVIMLNGEFHGLYTWNIPKDGWMFGLVEDATKQQAIVGADDHTTATQMKEASMTGFEVEFVSDEDNAAWVETSLTRMISAVMNSDGSDLDTTVAQYLDLDSCIDHFIHTVVDKATDCVDKNYLLVTFDGVKWYMSAYDRDSIHGLNWDASGTTRPVSNCSFVECAETVRIYELIKRFKTNALKARYKELRGNILSESRIMQVFENFAWAIPSPVMLEDVKLYPTILGSGVNTIDQIGRFVRQRLETCDAWVDALPAQENPPTTEPDTPTDGYTNLVPTSTDTDGSIYNGTGYKDNARLSSSGGVSSSSQTGSVVTGFMPFKNTGVIRMKGAEWLNMSTEHAGHHYYLSLYNSSKSLVTDGYVSAESYAGDTNTQSQLQVTYDEATGVTTFQIIDPTGSTGAIRNAAKSAAYFRLNAYGKGADLIVTVNEEITE